ncbi:hypothetical protein [Streptomyces sp. NPDC021356]|uniref:PRC-barrel domain-containing protein n=1 Tax=Streptomyces sp. NPDC021356 TaxID=3154900 RepID=UPI0033C136E5
MMLFTQAVGLPVITAEEAELLGRVDSLTVDAHTRSIACLRLSKARRHAEPIAWEAVEAMGRDAVIVRSRATSDPGTRNFPTHHEVIGHRLLTEHGVARGTVKDVAFDDATGHIHMLYTALGDISGERLLSVGSYAVVVRAEPTGPTGTKVEGAGPANDGQ